MAEITHYQLSRFVHKYVNASTGDGERLASAILDLFGDEWKTIESAPRDGKAFISWGDAARPARISVRQWTRFIDGKFYAPEPRLFIEPLYWHPLPSLPKESAP